MKQAVLSDCCFQISFASWLGDCNRGRDAQLDPREHPHLDHGYAVTSHSSQGQTAERVLIQVDTELAAKDLLTSRIAYVAVSRGVSGLRNQPGGVAHCFVGI